MMEEKDSKLSIMIIPKTKKVRRITIPNWLPKSILLSLTIIFILVVISFDWKANVNLNLEKDNSEKVHQIATLEKKIHKLEEINKEKDLIAAELQAKNQDLNRKVNEVEAKLEQIDKLKKQLENMAETNN